MTTNAHNDNHILISLNDACAMVSLSRTAINKMRSTGKFPEAVELGERRIAFVRAEVVAWVEARIAARAANDNASRNEVAA